MRPRKGSKQDVNICSNCFKNKIHSSCAVENGLEGGTVDIRESLNWLSFVMCVYILRC